MSMFYCFRCDKHVDSDWVCCHDVGGELICEDCLLGDHPNAEEILEILARNPDAPPSDVTNGRLRYSGVHVEAYEGWGTVEEAMEVSVLRSRRWVVGFHGDKFKAHQEAQRASREVHGLGFLERPNGKGRYNLDRPSNRAKVQAAYIQQIKAEEAE